jgi:hypothetical protein
MRDIVQVCGDTAWGARGDGAPTHDVESIIEHGGILCFPQLRFELSADEQRLLDPAVADGKAKNISLRGADDEVRGANPAHADALRRMIQRYRAQATTLAERLFPHYRGRLKPGNPSYRPVGVEGRVTSWRKDDTRLHVDAFPSRPTRGERILRVFCNVNPFGADRVWRVGEPFEAMARRLLPAVRPMIPGEAACLSALHVTRGRRSEYDHMMLGLHDCAKSDLDYQRASPQREVRFVPGTTWICFSDQVMHAAASGQYMLEQTTHLPLDALYEPRSSPLAILERISGRPLIAA